MVKKFSLVLFLFAFSAVSIAETPDKPVNIPAGEFIMGVADGQGLVGVEVGVDTLPAHKVYLKQFYMDRYEVTNKEYKLFLDSLRQKGVKSFNFYEDEGIPIPYWWNKKGTYLAGEDDYPVVDVDWYMANEYCKAQGKRLPSEEEWEKAARGTDNRLFPSGNEYKDGSSNNSGYWIQRNIDADKWRPMPVGSFDKDVNAYGVFDMTGNVMEWTSSLYRPYPGSGLKRDIFKEDVYVLRGGSFMTSPFEFGRATSRHFRRPTDSRSLSAEIHTDITIGFRCAKDAE